MDDDRSCSDLICLVCVFLVAGAFFLALQNSNSSCNIPSVYIQELYAPALNQTTTSRSSLNTTSIFIDLDFKRSAVGVFTNFTMNVHYGVDPSFPVANHTVPGFRMGDKRSSAHYRAAVEAPRLPWSDALQRVSGGSTVAFVVELLGQFRAKDCGLLPWEVNLQAEVWVDASGHMISKEPILFDNFY